MRISFAPLSDQRGTSAIEFAILAPVFLLMLAGMLAYGLYFGAAHSLAQLAADAARTSLAGITSSERDRLVRSYIEANAEDYVLLDRRQLRFSIGDKPGDPAQYRVTLTYDASDLPIWALSPPLPLPSQIMRYTSTIRRGGI
jgi:Flp pilus assembly protein TadG